MDAPILLKFKYSWGREGSNRCAAREVWQPRRSLCHQRTPRSLAARHPGTSAGPLQAPSAARASRWTPAAARRGLLGRGWIQPLWQAAISGWSSGTPGATRRDAAAAVWRRRRAGGTLPVVISPGHLQWGWTGLSPSLRVPSCSQAGRVGDAPSPLPAGGSLLAIRGCPGPPGRWGKACGCTL